jgi:hypothetical protein
LRVYSRKIGARADYAYYGYSARFRGITPAYGAMVALKHLSRGRLREVEGFVRGYARSWWRGDPRIEDLEIRRYFSTQLGRKARELFRGRLWSHKGNPRQCA